MLGPLVARQHREPPGSRCPVSYSWTDRSRQALAAGLISFAEKIDATIIAEGIERRAEVAVLVDLGVSYGQGFFFAKPAPLAKLSLEPEARKRRAAM